MTSYAGNQEDVRLRRIVELLPTTTYVDIGAGDPIEGSVTYWLYTQGWRGVLVEPGARSGSLLAARPEDIVIAAAVGTAAGDAVLYETSPDAGMSTMREDRLRDVLALGQTVTQVQIPVLTLSDVFERAIGPVSVLSVDVEGAEADVLSSLDWERMRPTVVVVEAILPWRAVSTRADFEGLLFEAGYVEAAFDGVNVWFVDARHPGAQELGRALSYPVSLLDRWEMHTTVSLRDSVFQLRDTAARLQEAVDAERLAVARSGAELDAAQRQLTDLRAELATARADVCAAAAQQAKLGLEVREQEQRSARRHAEVEAQLGHAREQAEQLRAELEAIRGSTTWRYGAPVAHALRRHKRRLELLSHPGTAAVRARERARVRVDQVRLKRAGPNGRASIAVARQTHPAFRDPIAAAPPGVAPRYSSWSEAAAAVLMDRDEELRARLERRTGVRVALERGVLLAALAEAVAERGAKSPSRGAFRRESVVLDARAIQDPALSSRGVGRYAWELLAAIRKTGAHVTAFVDHALPPLDDDDIEQVDVISTDLAARTFWLVQPSPLTHEQWPLTALLDSAQVWCTTIVYDFIPSRFPAVYLRQSDDVLRHAAREQSLRLYDEHLAISATTLGELGLMGCKAASAVVWPALPEAGIEWPGGAAAVDLPDDYVLVSGGFEHRKNIVSGLAAVALVKMRRPSLEAVVMGWTGPADQLRALAEDVGLPLEALHIMPFVDELDATRARRACLAALVPSFAEGLSLPVIEAVRDGAPVVASAISAHRELLGDGPWLGDPAQPQTLAAALEAVIGDKETVRRCQQRSLAAHRHLTVDEAVSARYRKLTRAVAKPASASSRRGRPLLAVVTPWPPQRTGVGEYSEATLSPLADSVDLTVAVSASARVLPRAGLTATRASVAEPSLALSDELVTVLGNSHFHLPGLEVIETRGGVALCHDVRLTELNSYLGLQDQTRVRNPASASLPRRRTLRHDLEAAPSLGFEHVSKYCRLLLFHSTAAAAWVAAETGAPTSALPFVPYRAPADDERSPRAREGARASLGFADGEIHLGLVGGVDVRTKAADTIIEAHAWLRQWGHRVVLHVVGAVEPALKHALDQMVSTAGTSEHVVWHGHVDDSAYRRFLIALDLGVQLRSSALLTLSGAAADLAAFGLRSVATQAMVHDMELPEFVESVPDDFSPLIVAEALERAMLANTSNDANEEQRLHYLRSHSVAAYGTQLLEAIGFPPP